MTTDPVMHSTSKRNVSEFFEKDLPAYASYDNMRKICSYIDGMKISMRKIVFTLLEKYPGKDKVKTETVANVCAAFTNYLHGAANLGGVIDTCAQSFVGSNAYPLFDGNSGGFGTRINPTCAANRYTKIAINPLVKTLLNDADSEIIGRQFFEGTYIEPQFFVPTFPILFLNGSHGMSTGFSHDIYPRNPDEIISYIKKRLNGTEHPRMDLLPWFRGHTGKVAYNKELDRNESFGVVVKNNMTSYTITELPIGMEYQKYVEILDKFIDDGIIQDYYDKCDTTTDKILFELKTTREFTRKHESERSVYEALKLIKSLPETLCCIDENNRVREFKSVNEILDAFIDIRLKYYDKRKAWLLSTMKDKLDVLSSKYLFVKGIVEETIVVNKKKKEEIIAQLEKIPKIIKVKDSYQYLLDMPIHSLSREKLDELKEQIENIKAEIQKTKGTSIADMWTNDLHDLKKEMK